MREGPVLDITLDLESEARPYPGDTPFGREEMVSFAAGGDYLLSRLSMSAHSGTHLDAPAHLLPAGRRLGDYLPEDFLLVAQVVDWRGEGPVGPEVAGRVEEGVQALLIRTGGPDTSGGQGGLDPVLAQECVRLGLKLVGIDAFSVDAAGSTAFEVHRILGRAGILILENARLTAALPGRYGLICLPLAMAGAEASPVRALLIAEETPSSPAADPH